MSPTANELRAKRSRASRDQDGSRTERSNLQETCRKISL